ncbi:39019_t:CDS:1, partial [Gigaspora margarita]
AQWYHSINDPIILDELSIIIKKLLDKKAVGPQAVSNEMLKHLDEYALNIMLQ